MGYLSDDEWQEPDSCTDSSLRRNEVAQTSRDAEIGEYAIDDPVVDRSSVFSLPSRKVSWARCSPLRPKSPTTGPAWVSRSRDTYRDTMAPNGILVAWPAYG